ncbi:MAG TPA: beta-propeller fold lactonase family protein [Bacteriovoracaceae bacterium]|nr:beta-propeller fold lactonase family protein [Bacteriovoracaceae bacterium]
MKNTIKLFGNLSLFALLFQACNQSTDFAPYKDDQVYSHFLIAADQTNSTLTPFGIRTKGAAGSLKVIPDSTVSAAGAYVVSATPDGKIILSAGSRNSYGYIESFSINKSTGRLTSVGQVQVPRASTDLPTNLSFITIHPNSKYAYVTDGRSDAAGNFAPGKIHILKIEASGAISHIGAETSNNLDWPMGIAIHPDGKYAYVSNYAPGRAVDNKISAYEIDDETGALTELSFSPITATTTKSPRNLTISASGEHLYVVDEYNDPTHISSFTIGADGSLTSQGFVSPDSGTLGAAVAIDPDDRIGFFTNRTDNTLLSFPVNTGSTSLQISSTIGSQGIQPVTVFAHPSLNYVYVGHQASGHISAFSYNPTSGALANLYADASGEKNSPTGTPLVLPGVNAKSSFITIVTLPK